MFTRINFVFSSSNVWIIFKIFSVPQSNAYLNMRTWYHLFLKHRKTINFFYATILRFYYRFIFQAKKFRFRFKTTTTKTKFGTQNYGNKSSLSEFNPKTYSRKMEVSDLKLKRHRNDIGLDRQYIRNKTKRNKTSWEHLVNQPEKNVGNVRLRLGHFLVRN